MYRFGALPGKNIGCTGWEHSKRKGNTRDVQVGSIPWERETHMIYRLGAFLGKGKHTGCTGWEHSLGKGNTQDVQVGSIPWERETHRIYRLGAFLG